MMNLNGPFYALFWLEKQQTYHGNVYGAGYIKKCSQVKFGAKDLICLEKHEKHLIQFLAVNVHLNTKISKLSKEVNLLTQQLEAYES